MKNKIYALISGTPAYDIMMICAISISVTPLVFKHPPAVFFYTDMATCGVFIFDYIARWVTADLSTGRKNPKAALIYPVTPMAIIDLLTILPTFAPISSAFKALRMLRLFRVLRVFKFFRYSRNIQILAEVLRTQRQSLITVGVLAVGYIFVSALILFQLEPDTFPDFFDALYWATVSLTTVGYGDIFAVSDVGRLMTMLSALIGIAVVALPAGIITAGYLDAIEKNNKKPENPTL